MEQKPNLDYLAVLRALREIPFGVGKKLLTEFLQGSETHESIKRNNLNKLETFGSLAYDGPELSALIDSLVLNDFIKQVPIRGNNFVKVFEISAKGIEEIENPSFYKRKLSFHAKKSSPTEITERDKELFSALGTYLEKYTDEQKKAITCSNDKILCIAGAGSGKTTVLTKRIEFLTNYRSVNSGKILAITFTRKARQEMQDRLDSLGLSNHVFVETFNSFCEKQLNTHNNLVYDKNVQTISYRDKFRIMQKALLAAKTTIDSALSTYFTDQQSRGKTPEQLATIFMNDCFFIRDYFAFKKQTISKDNFVNVDMKHRNTISLIVSLCSYIDDYMKKHGLRDFADQLLDTISLFEKHKEVIPSFEHILVDEFQDVNTTQMHLLNLLDAPNLFCVGDPRQSIFGWRGSDIRFILQFEDTYPNCEVISLTKNFRSTESIVSLINTAISPMGLPNLEAANIGLKHLKLLAFSSEKEEFSFILQKIKDATFPKEEIFILARTNRALTDFSAILQSEKVPHIVRSDELRKTVLAKEGEVTLATIHAAKGLEASLVFVIGATATQFPCKGTEHPIIELVKVEEYDKEEEERRLFYVALSRAKKQLYVTYTGNHTYFISEKMKPLFETDDAGLMLMKERPKVSITGGDVVARLKQWRFSVSKDLGIPAYMVLHDKTLIELSQHMPMTISDLQNINGFGPMKISKYGEQILDVLHG